MKRPLATIACAVMVGLVMPVFPSNAEPALASDENSTDDPVTAHLHVEGTTNDDGTGQADTDSTHVPFILPGQLIPGWNFGGGELLDETPCVGYGTAADMAPEDICASYDGYAYGWQANDNLRHQRVCFDEISENPSPSIYHIKDLSVSQDTTPPTTTHILTAGIPLHPPPYGQTLADAVQQFNRNRNPDIGGVETHDSSYEVATIPDYSNIGTLNLRGSLIDYYHWPYTAYPPDMGNGRVHPVERRWSETRLGMQRSADWAWRQDWTVNVYAVETYTVNISNPPNPPRPVTRTRRGRFLYSYPTSTYRTAETFTPVVTDSGLGPGLSPWRYYQELEDIVDAIDLLEPAPPGHSAPCTATRCSSSSQGPPTLIYEFQHDAAHVPGGTERATLPAFWKVWQEFGTHQHTTQPGQGNEKHITQLIYQGVGWLDPTRAKEYRISYYTCRVHRNGELVRAWVVGVPFPRLGPSSWTFTNADNAVVGDYVLPPDPQSPPGLRTANADPPMQAAPPVHVPVPLYDIGSGMDLHPPSPDGGWWATVGTIDDETDCVNAGVRICLAKALRPWRAVWYIEPPPPVSAIASTGLIPTTYPRAPSDVRVCYYTDDGALPGVLSDQPREGSGSGSGYEVSVPVPGNAGAMVHALHSAGLADKRAWLTDWLYGPGPDLARAYGQDQVDPDRYCWYKWYQAQNDSDGFEGVLAVEWLATLYIGVPSDPFAYCQDGVQGSHAGLRANPTQFHLTGPGLYNCHYNSNTNFYSPRNYWKAVAVNWNDPRPGSPSASLFWYGDRIDRFSYCRVGSAWLDDMERPFDWFLQAATIIVENEQEAGPGGREAMHPLGASNSRVGSSARWGRTPALLPDPNAIPPGTQPGGALPNNWWRGDSSQAVGAPQNQATNLNNPLGSPPGLPAVLPDDSGALPHAEPWRKYQPHVTALEYPIGTTLAGTGGHRDCDQVPVTVKSLPCQSWTGGACRSTTRNWWDMFHYQVDAQGNPVIVDGEPAPASAENSHSDLWAWWSQNIGEVRHQVFPIPVDP